MPHILGYARVSTGDQDLTGQRQRLEAVGTLRIFDDVVSGKTFERPGLAELLNVVETLKKRGVALLSLEEKIDSSPAAGELAFHVCGAIAQFERRLISGRTRDGVNAGFGRSTVYREIQAGSKGFLA